MAWLTKTKIPQEGDDERILTPDGNTILVGSPENLILLWQADFTNWVNKVKIAAGAWANKAKIAAGAWALKNKVEP